MVATSKTLPSARHASLALRSTSMESGTLKYKEPWQSGSAVMADAGPLDSQDHMDGGVWSKFWMVFIVHTPFQTGWTLPVRNDCDQLFFFFPFWGIDIKQG